MAKSTQRAYLVLFAGICMALSLAACSSNPVSNPLSSPTSLSVAASTSIPPTSTPAPPTSTPNPPTQTPTATPPPGIRDYLVAANQDFSLTIQDKDMREMLTYPQYIDEYDVNGNYSYHIKWWMGAVNGPYLLNETITIAEQPWTELPRAGFPGSEQYNFGRPEKRNGLPVVGQISQAYQDGNDPSLVRFVFIKGNTLVNIIAQRFSVEDVVNIGKLIEARLPEMLPVPPPISFPDQLDPKTYAEYFKEVTLGNLSPDGGIDPADVFQTDKFFTWDYVAISDAAGWVLDPSYDSPSWTTAVYDLGTGRYIFKHTAIWSRRGIKPVRGFYPLPVGKYEFKLAMKGALVYSTPFEIVP